MNIRGRKSSSTSALACLLASSLLGAGCAQYSYYGLSATVEPSKLEDPKLLRLPASQRTRVATALSMCDGAGKQIYAIKAAEVNSTQRWKAVSLLATALGTVAIGAGFLAANREVSIDPATGRADVHDSAGARLATGLGLLTTGIGAAGTFYLSLSTSQAELDRLSALAPQIESARTTFNSALVLDDADVIDRQLRQLEDFCRQSLVPVAAYDGDQRLAGLFGNEAVNNLSRELARKIDESERKRAGVAMDSVAAGRKFEALARALGYAGARMIGAPWQVGGSGGERVHAIPLRALEPDLKKLAAARAAGQISVAIYSPDDRTPPAFAISAALAGGERTEGTDAVIGRVITSLIAPAIDLERLGGGAVVATALSIAPYTQSVPAALNEWLCGLRAPPLVTSAAGPKTVAAPGCRPVAVPIPFEPSLASLRSAFHLAALPAAGAGDDRLVVRMEGLGPNTPGPALASLVWIEGRPLVAANVR